MRPALRPVAAAFAGFGFFAGSFAVAAIDIERAFHLSDAGLGFLLAVGILTATAIAAVGGALTDRIGASALFVRALAVWGALLLVEAGAPNLVLFVPAFALATGAGGLVDVVMNILAADALSTTPGRLVRFHGLFNAGAVMGAVFTGVVLRLDVSWRVVWAIVAIGAFTIAVVAPRAHIPDPPRGDHVSMGRALVGLRHEGLLVLALVFAASAMVEGGIATWGVLYLRAHLGVGVLAGVGAYAVGAFLATLARIGGGTRVGALGTRRAVAIGAGLAAAGLAAEALVRTPLVAGAGLAFAALGISVVWPLLVADANNEARHPTLAIGGITAAGYLGMVTGPPIVGVLSNAFGLRVGLLMLAGIALVVACVPARVRTHAHVR